MKKIMLLMAAAASLVGYAADKGEAEASKSLILYYSQTGATQTVAQALQQETGADIELIEAVKPYDGDYDATIKRCQEEMAAGTEVEIKALKADVAQYDTIYVGYPVWFGTYAPPVATLLKTARLEGKVIVPFCTFGSGGLTNTVASMREQLAKSTVLDGFGIRNARLGKLGEELPQYLVNVGIKAGQPVLLPEFSEQREATEAEKAIFDAACGDYPLPLGTPTTVGQRKVSGGTEYLFTAKGRMGDLRIHVIASDSAGAKPEFTLVER